MILELFHTDEIFEKILPEIKKFCLLLKAHEEEEFIEVQLLRIASLMDFQDEVGRRLLSQLLRKLSNVVLSFLTQSRWYAAKDIVRSDSKANDGRPVKGLQQ